MQGGQANTPEQEDAWMDRLIEVTSVAPQVCSVEMDALPRVVYEVTQALPTSVTDLTVHDYSADGVQRLYDDDREMCELCLLCG